MATIGDYFEEQAVLEFRDSVYGAMANRGVEINDLAELLECDAKQLEFMLETGDGLTIRIVAKILFRIGYRPIVCASPLGKSHFEQAIHWTQN